MYTGSLDEGVMRSGADEELKELQELMLDRQPMGALISIAKTVDQVSGPQIGLRWGVGAADCCLRRRQRMRCAVF